MNLAHQLAQRLEMSVEEAREYYDGDCIAAAGEVADTVPNGRLAYFNLPWWHKWKYHAAAEVDGVIHDLWEQNPLPLKAYMKKLGAESVEYPAEEPD